jgi:hypothetical protein
VQICPQCGNAFDGDQCSGCAPPKANVDKTVVSSFAGALAGVLLTLFAVVLFPPLAWDPQALLGFLAFTFISLILSLMLRDQLARYITFVRALCVLASAGTFILAAFFFLNGALDEHPPVEVDVLVSTKYVSHGRNAGPRLVLGIAWNERRIEKELSVSRRTFSLAEPGDPVRITVHPGAFSTPWSRIEWQRDIRLNSQ